MRFVIVENGTIIEVTDTVENLPDGVTAYESVEGIVGDVWPLQPVRRWAVIESDRVVNVIAARSELPGLQMVLSDTTSIGDLFDGVTFSPAPPAPVPVPPVLSARQARLALNAAGLRTAVEQAVTQADQDTRDEWEYATTIERHSPLVASIGSGLGLTDAQIDDLFRDGATR